MSSSSSSLGLANAGPMISVSGRIRPADHWPKVYAKFMQSWRAAIPKGALAEAYPTLYRRAPEDLKAAFEEFWEGVVKFYQEEINSIFEAENIYKLWDELEQIRHAVFTDNPSPVALEPPTVSPEDEMRTLAVDVKAANRDQLAKIVAEMKARNDALESELYRLDGRAKVLLPRVEEKLQVFERLRQQCAPLVATAAGGSSSDSTSSLALDSGLVSVSVGAEPAPPIAAAAAQGSTAE